MPDTQETPQNIDAKEPLTSSTSPEEAPLEVCEGSGRNDGGFIAVGIGASAGGLEALLSLTGTLKPGRNMCYIIAQHLAPKRSSLLTALLARATHLPTVEVQDGEYLEADTIYITPPNSDVFVEGDHVRIVPPRESPGPKPSVTRLFKSLAAEYGDHAVGIILSGTGTDGAEGIRAIKEAGGVTIAQDELTAKYAGMPNAAIDTGCVDIILSPERTGADLEAIARSPANWQTPRVSQQPQSTLDEITSLFRTHRQIDLSHYKPSTLGRRIEARMAARQVTQMDGYLTLLQNDEKEITNLAKSILISVTSFFRDEQAFEALKPVIERIVAEHTTHDELRVWVPGCCTGEEVYSLAMLFAEVAGEGLERHKLQIFGTDLDEDAINIARRGIYPAESIEAIPKLLQEKYLSPIGTEYQIIKPLRDLTVFAKHDVINNPPFIRQDLISCRNLLIYFTTDLQERVLRTFHYALKPTGHLFLGKSETTSPAEDCFNAIDRTHRIFRYRRTAAKAHGRLTPMNNTISMQPPAEKKKAKKILLQDETNRQLAKAYAPPSVVIDEHFNIVFGHGDIDRYLQIKAGNTETDLLSVAPESMNASLRSLVAKVLRENMDAKSARLRVDIRGEPMYLSVEMRPLSPDGRPPLIAVSFVESALVLNQPGPADPTAIDEAAGERISELEHELAVTREHLQTVIQELETSNEELQSMNEEMQSANEELQATNEELETTNEELQSMNEELTTVNEELDQKASELNRAYTDINNIQNSVTLPIIVIDLELRLNRYNNAAMETFGISDEALGQDSHRLLKNLGAGDLTTRMLKVLETEEAFLEDVSIGEYHYRMFIHPCRDEVRRLIGAIIAFDDITVITNTRHALEDNKMKLASLLEMQASILDTLPVHVAMLDGDGNVVAMNRAWREFAQTEIVGTSDVQIGDNYLSAFEARTGLDGEYGRQTSSEVKRMLDGEADRFDLECAVGRADDRIWFRCIGRVVSQGPQDVQGRILLARVDITERKRAELALEVSYDEAHNANMAKSFFLANMSHELRTPLNAIIGFSDVLAQESFGPLGDERYRTYVRDIRDSGLQLNHVLSGLLDLSRIDAGKFHLEEEPLNLAEIMEQALRIAKQSCDPERDLAISDMPQGLTLLADRQILFQILDNLLTNAIKFTPANGTIRFGASRTDNGDLEIKVADNGVGMPEDFAKRALEPFAQSEQPAFITTKRGLGLGLPLVKRFVQNHGGSIKIDTKLSAGTTVMVTFPAERVSSPKANA